MFLDLYLHQFFPFCQQNCFPCKNSEIRLRIRHFKGKSRKWTFKSSVKYKITDQLIRAFMYNIARLRNIYRLWTKTKYNTHHTRITKLGSGHHSAGRYSGGSKTSDATGHVQLDYIVCLADFVSLVTYESDVYFRISPRVGIAPDENTHWRFVVSIKDAKDPTRNDAEFEDDIYLHRMYKYQTDFAIDFFITFTGFPSELIIQK